MKEKNKRLPDSELEVMQIIWDCLPPVARAIIEEKMKEIHPIAQTTLLTLLSRLSDKGFIKIEKQGRSSVYTPIVQKEDYLKEQSRLFLHQTFQGNIRSFASALCDGGLSKEDLKELKELLDQDAL
ncbi:MAG: BlaI/MecI/CopY family transcriptional regulator [Eubacteriales bacterium]|nr:BlaI/MecI/CopY family transcriptional regulator [Eubacteriales bacterium]